MTSSKFRLCAALLALSAWTGSALAANLSVTATPASVTAGNEFDVSVMVSSITDLSAYIFTLSFDPTLIKAGAATEGSFMASGGATTFFDGGAVDNTAGTITFSFNALIGPVSGVTGSGTLVTYHFTTTGTSGTSALTLSDTSFLDSQSSDISVQNINGSVAITAAVPEPSTYLLMGAGVVGLLAWRRRQAAA